MRKIKLAIFLVLLASNSAIAAEDYRCTVKEAKSLEKKGVLEATSWSRLLEGQEFVIDRSSGKIFGGKGFSNHNGKFGQPKVIDRGSNDQSFKALTVYGPNVAVSYLQVAEHEPSAEKPFLLLTNSNDVLTGICVHF